MSGILDYFFPPKKTTANVAKERLQIVVSHQNYQDASKDFVQNLKDELIDVITKYTKVDQEQVQVRLQGSILELNVVLPDDIESND